MKIALCGPPHAGKSVLRQRLKTAIESRRPDGPPFVLSANPDGEGSWFQKAYENDPELALAAKREAKQRWTPGHADLYASWVRNTTSPLVLIDLGGVVDDFNRQICALATHAVLLAPREEDFSVWREFAGECGLVVLAELVSDYGGVEDRVDWGEPFRARVHRLERGELETPRPAVEALAEYILTRLERR